MITASASPSRLVRLTLARTAILAAFALVAFPSSAHARADEAAPTEPSVPADPSATQPSAAAPEPAAPTEPEAKAAPPASPTATPVERAPTTAPLAPKAEPSSERHGFTMELVIGPSWTSYVKSGPNPGRVHDGLGIQPISAGIGGYLSPRLALLGRLAATSTFYRDSSDQGQYLINYFYGANLRYWLTDRFFLGGGPGLALLVSAPADGPQPSNAESFVLPGIGLNARAGYVFALPVKGHGLSLGVDAFGAHFSDTTTTVAGALNLGWHLL